MSNYLSGTMSLGANLLSIFVPSCFFLLLLKYVKTNRLPELYERKRSDQLKANMLAVLTNQKTNLIKRRSVLAA